MTALSWFEAYGIELEYMIVDRETLAVRPVADELLKAVGGAYDMEVERGEVAWSNELALHVIEMKTNGPTPSLAGWGRRFTDSARDINALLEPMGAQLMPGAMHPWMDPGSELRLWSHEDDLIYRTFHRIFDCRGHGWANLQSMHINLPFAGDDQFGRLHAAIRLALPILPALAASSPVVDGARHEALDARLRFYAQNAARVPSVSGRVIPEPVFDRATYEGQLLAGIYADLAPLDPEGVLAHEWVNARGCIARFDRGALEIRVLDVQECPAQDLAIAAAVVAVVKALTEERWTSYEAQRAWDTERLASILQSTVKDGDDAVIDDGDYLAALGAAPNPVPAGELWRRLIASELPADSEWAAPLATIADHGCLARRIARALGAAPTSRPPRQRVAEVYRDLSACLAEGRPFVPNG